MRKSSAFTLIELLIVIAIIGILMSLLFPAVNSAMDAARKAHAKNDVTQIATAITAYMTEYGKWPGLNIGNNDSGVSGEAISVTALIGGNPRQITFLEPQNYKPKKGGVKDVPITIGTNTNIVTLIYDPWDNPYKAVVDYDYNNRITVSSGKETGQGSTNETLIKGVAVFNISESSSDRSKSNYFRHSVKSW